MDDILHLVVSALVGLARVVVAAWRVVAALSFVADLLDFLLNLLRAPVRGVIAASRAIWRAIKLRALRRRRANWTRDHFVRSFRPYEYPKEALHSAYLDLTRLTGAPVAKDDSLLGALRVQSFDPILEERFEQLGCRDEWESQSWEVQMGRQPALRPPFDRLSSMQTAEDYVRILAELLSLRDRRPPSAEPIEAEPPIAMRRGRRRERASYAASPSSAG